MHLRRKEFKNVFLDICEELYKFKSNLKRGGFPEGDLAGGNFLGRAREEPWRRSQYFNRMARSLKADGPLLWGVRG